MASIAGTVLFLYASILGKIIPDAVAHLLIASIVSAPAALVIAFIMVPPEGVATGGKLEMKSDASSSMDALTQGTLGGAQLLVNIVAMLVVFVALVTLVNLAISPYSLQGLLGWVLAPLAWLMGVPWHDAARVGALLGMKTVLNEFLAYQELGRLIHAGALAERSARIASYALCGFANFGSLAILLGGIGGLAPARHAEVARLGLLSIISGSLASFMTACVAGIFL